MASRDGKRRVLSYDERVLWTTVMKSVAPMHGALPEVQPSGPPQRAETPKAKRERVQAPLPAPAAAKPAPPP